MASANQIAQVGDEISANSDASNTEKWGFLALAAILVVGPFILSPVFMMQVMCFALLACSVNLLLGYGGLLSFGHAAFFGSAGYVCAYSAKVWGFPPEVAILAGTIAAVILGLLIGSLAIRRQGIYFSMITLASAQLVYFVSLRSSATGGEDGLQAIPRGYFLGIVDLRSDLSLYYVVAVVFFAGYLLSYRIIHSPFGQALQAIRADERRATSLGYKADRYKLLLFALSAFIAGLGGSMKAIVFQLASLTDVHWSTSGEALFMVLIGGMGTIFGPVVGAAVMVSMHNYFASLGEWVTVLQGVIFVLAVLVFRAGVIGSLAKRLRIRL
ncbi:branched-chain amino acid ABC transporter permease [Rhizobium sp. C4]|uniref:branched-chain amino acid ABC transporter permease n=1 Tax=Rhizobium sp. C4 TaxID=1349800 RepID=UPI0022A9BE75